MVNNVWEEYGDDCRHDGKSIQEALEDCENSSERESVIRGYLKYLND